MHYKMPKILLWSEIPTGDRRKLKIVLKTYGFTIRHKEILDKKVYEKMIKKHYSKV